MYAYIHLFFRLKGLNSQVRPSGSSADFIGETNVPVRYLVSCGFNHHDGESRALWGYTGQGFPAPMDVAPSLQCESQQAQATEPLCHPFSQHPTGCEGLTPTSLPRCSCSGAVPLSQHWQLSACFAVPLR